MGISDSATQTPNPSSKNKEVIKIILLVGGILVYAGVLVVVFLLGTRAGKQKPIQTILYPSQQPVVQGPTNTPVPTPTPRPLPHGKQTYRVSSKDAKGPLIQSVIIDPLDNSPGSAQSIQVEMAPGNEAESVSYILYGDKKQTKTLSLSPVQNSRASWSGQWTSELLHDYIYQANIQAKNTKGTTEITLSFR